VTQIYGLTETSPFLTVSRIKPHMHDWPAAERYRVQTKTGYPMLGVDIRVVDDHGKDVPADGEAVGEVIARSNVVMSGYWRQPEATESVIVDGGSTRAIWRRTTRKVSSRSSTGKRI
jgi:fatty-acyl-CoA synthase